MLNLPLRANELEENMTNFVSTTGPAACVALWNARTSEDAVTTEFGSVYVWKQFNSIGLFNSLWPSDAIWQHKSGSTLVQVMACCLTAPSHHLNQCWLTISKVPRHSPEGITIRSAADTRPRKKIENWIFKIASRFSRGQWVKSAYWGTVMPIFILGELNHHWCRQYLVSCLTASHHLNQCWFTIKPTLRNTFKWISNQNTQTFYWKKCIWKCYLPNYSHFIASMRWYHDYPS